MSLYPDPNITTPLDLVNYTNNNVCMDVSNPATCGMFGTIILFVIFGIVFISQKDAYPSQIGFALASFITWILSWLFRILGLTTDFIVIVFTVFTIIGAILIFKERG